MERSFSVPSVLLFLYCALFFLSLPPPSRAQVPKLFQWQFNNAQLSRSLPTCGKFPITVKAVNSTAQFGGSPPYYMMVLAKDGTPTTSFIGTDEGKLEWVVDQPIGTEVMLTVIDGNGNSGGVPPILYTVVAGQTTSCLPPSSTPESFTVVTNVTGRLRTCQPWELRIKGGVPPYNVTLAALGSPVITNVTVGLGDDIFTYINRADPGTKIIAVVSDVQGRWAQGSPLVDTYGSNNVDCVGLVSSTRSSAQINDSPKGSNGKGTIIGVVVAFSLLLLLGGAVIGFILWRRRKVQREVELGPDLTPRHFDLTPTPYDATHDVGSNAGGQVLSISSFISTPTRYLESPTTMSEAQSTTTPIGQSIRTGPSALGSSNSLLSSPMPVADPFSRNRPSFTTFPARPARGYNKLMEATGYAQAPYSGRSPASAPGSTDNYSPFEQSEPTASTYSQSGITPTAQEGDLDTVQVAGGDFVFQHRDAGLPRELPPPYADRNGS